MSENGGQSPQRRKCYKLAKDIGLTRQERLDLAEYLIRRDVTSWDALDEVAILRLLDAMDGYLLVTALLLQRAPVSS